MSNSKAESASTQTASIQNEIKSKKFNVDPSFKVFLNTVMEAK
jgi:hypothetical protein